MADQPLETGSALASYISDVKKQIKAGLGDDASPAGPIELEMSTTLEKSKGAGFFISVLKAGAEVKHEEVHKIKIPIKLNSEADKMEEEARTAEAIFRKTMSEKKVERLEQGSHPSHLE